MSKLGKIFRLKWKYLLYGSRVYVEKGSTFECGSNVKIRKAKIHLTKNSHISIGNNTVIQNTVIAVSKGIVKIGEESLISKGKMPVDQRITITNGTAVFGNYNRIQSERIWVRFDGKLNTGDYVFINEYSEIRCDESIKIGSFNRFSYKLKLWDTNTHEIEPALQRRKRWQEKGLLIDVDVKPKTKPVVIGNDCWVGDTVSILKGSTLGDGCIVGTGTTIIGKEIPEKTTVISEIHLKMIPNKV